MLILSRVPPQKIIIGDKGDVSISVLSVDRNEVKLGLIATQGIAINRLEKIHQPTQQRRKTALSIKIKALISKIVTALPSTSTVKPLYKQGNPK